MIVESVVLHFNVEVALADGALELDRADVLWRRGPAYELGALAQRTLAHLHVNRRVLGELEREAGTFGRDGRQRNFHRRKVERGAVLHRESAIGR